MRRTTTAGSLVLAGCVLAALLAGCTEDVDASRNRGERVRPLQTYVALGDSYTSGPRLGSRTGPAGCEQTSGNYPHLLAERLDLDLVDASCGGATTGNLEDPQTPPNGKEIPPQLDAVTEDADLVTLSLGGNDARAFGTLVTTCVGLAQEDRDGSPCTTLAAKGRGAVERQLAGLAGRIEDAVGEILDRAPDARVIVVGYPQIFPPQPGCDRLPLARGDYRLAHDVLHQLVAAQERGAKAAGAEYVDVWSATKGHDICSDDPWIAGIVPERRALAYHPYAEEQRVVADLLVEQVRNRPREKA